MAQFPLIDQASIAMIPGAYKESKVYSQLPTDGSGDFTFSRGTDNATRVNEEGLIEKGYENTLLGSNDWARDDSSYTITGGEAGYDGTNDAWLVNKLAAAYFSKDALVLTGVHTISFYAKAGSLDRIFVFIGGEAARFDLTNGTAVSAGGNPVSQNIELVSGTTDWYRCSIVINKNTTQNFLIKPQNSSNQDVTGTIYIQDAQLNQGLVAYPYLETTASPAYGGITDNQPRLDYTDSSCPALLLEPQRTNVLTNSEHFSGWSTAGGTITRTDNATTSPEGVDNAARVVSSSTGARMRGGNVSVTSGEKWTYSIFAKENTTDSFIMRHEVSANFSVTFDLGDESFTGSGGWYDDAAIEDYGDGWYRCIVYLTADSTENRSFELVFYNNDDLYFYGAQAELGSYATSYIPTYGTSQTRSKDSCKNTTITDFQSTDATLFFEFNYDSSKTGNFRYVFSTENSTASNFDLIGLQSNSSGNNFFFTITNSGISFPTLSLLSGTNKVLLKLKRSTKAVKTFLNGTEVTSATATSIPEIHKIALGGRLNAYSGFATDRELGDIVKQALVFPTALTDSECIALTTL